jgi:hypothetical protein
MLRFGVDERQPRHGALVLLALGVVACGRGFEGGGELRAQRKQLEREVAGCARR